MQTPHEAAFADVFVCDDETNWHSYYYISPDPVRPDALCYSVSRTGIERRLPRLFSVERGPSTPFCQIFCIFSGRGTLHYRDRQWPLRENQIVLLSAGEAHTYRSDPDLPLGLIWMEFYGGDSCRLVRHILSHQSPVLEGAAFGTVSAGLSALQQKLMVDEHYQPSIEIYQLLYCLLQWEQSGPAHLGGAGIQNSLSLVQSFIDAHLTESVSNQMLAEVCGVSTAYFVKRFQARYHLTPQEYIMQRRVTKSQYLLTQTAISVERIAELLGFCNTSHFIRRFKACTDMTPAAYRRTYSLHPGEPS